MCGFKLSVSSGVNWSTIISGLVSENVVLYILSMEINIWCAIGHRINDINFNLSICFY